MFKDIDIKFVDKEITPFGGLSLFLKMVEPVVSEPLNTVGNQENTVGKSLMVVFVGMCLGVAVGSIAIPVGLSVPMKLGLAGGASTDTPALAYANSVANNPANSLPASSYATVYPLTVFMRIFTAQMMVMVAAA